MNYLPVQRHTCVNNDILHCSFNQPDVAAVTFKEVQLTNQIQPVMYLLSIEPMTIRCLLKQQLYNLPIKCVTNF